MSSKLDKIIYPNMASTLFLVYPAFDLWCICATVYGWFFGHFLCRG